MEKVQKFLMRLQPQEQKEIINLLAKIISGTLLGLDIKKLKGYKDIYRVRTGNIRIIFRRSSTEIRVLEISRRNEKTYRDY